jgi:septal ring factor EnvC (AmiA/AmiB activator)
MGDTESKKVTVERLFRAAVILLLLGMFSGLMSDSANQKRWEVRDIQYEEGRARSAKIEEQQAQMEATIKELQNRVAEIEGELKKTREVKESNAGNK